MMKGRGELAHHCGDAQCMHRPKHVIKHGVSSRGNFQLSTLGQRWNWRLALMMAAYDQNKIKKPQSMSYCRNPHQGHRQ